MLPILYRVLATVLPLLPVVFRRKLWFYAGKVGSRWWQPEGRARRIPGGMYLKACAHSAEPDIQRYIKSATNIPVPLVIDQFTFKDTTYMVMSCMPGEPVWPYVLRTLTPEQEDRLSQQLSRMMASLRAIPPPSDRVCGWDGGPIYCERVSYGARPVGPFENVDAFHQHLLERAGPLSLAPQDELETINDTIRRAHARHHRVCLTHNDLGPQNVLVDDELNITGIIDWEGCAWLPEYWCVCPCVICATRRLIVSSRELTMGTFNPFWRKGKWRRIMTAAFPSYEVEQEAELYIVMYRKWYG